MRIDKVYIVNSNKCIDKWNDIQKRFHNLCTVHRWPIVDETDISRHVCRGQKVDKSDLERFLSHYFLWKHIVECELDYVLIMEDDVIPCDIFCNWKKIDCSFDDILFLGTRH
jgi:GR25 family glycosyltransferase involved in LPS biosynthesis